MRATTADIRRRVTMTTTVAPTARLGTEPFLDGVRPFDRARTQTHRLSSGRAYEEVLKRRAAPRRPGPPYEYSGAHIPVPPGRPTSPRTTSPGERPTRRFNASRRRQRRPQSTTCLSS
jgi:hypothetical protein